MKDSLSRARSTVRILVVEDEAIIARDIQNILSRFGYQVSGMASSGEESIRKARDLNPDLVLMDVRLKGPMDGIEAAHRIYDGLHIPVVYLTAFGEEKILEDAQPINGFMRIVKPFEENDIQCVIQKILPHNNN
jgi:CheY-like chemotaxis protein